MYLCFIYGQDSGWLAKLSGEWSDGRRCVGVCGRFSVTADESQFSGEWDVEKNKSRSTAAQGP